MKTTSCAALGLGLALVAGCGGTVVFEEDGNDGGGGSGLSGPGTTTNVGPGGGDGGAPNTSGSTSSVGPGSSVSVGPTTSVSVGPTTSVSVGPTTSVVTVTSTSTGTPGCGSLGEELGLPFVCDNCLDQSCCDEMIACDEGTPCWNCIFFNSQCNAAQDALDALSFCAEQSCGPECNGGKCGPGDFFCEEDGQCIPEELVCNGFPDCSQGSDEFCGCGPEDFQCFESGECIPGNWQCDGEVDCDDGTDEEFCGECQPGDFQCVESGECIPGEWVCDDIVDCQDGSDETCGEGVLITEPGVAYGHHGDCEGWNACGDAETCAQWACQAEGFGQLASFGEDRPCTQWDNCHLLVDGCCGGVDYDWGNWCDVRGVSEIRCIP